MRPSAKNPSTLTKRTVLLAKVDKPPPHRILDTPQQFEQLLRPAGEEEGGGGGGEGCLPPMVDSVRSLT